MFEERTSIGLRERRERRMTATIMELLSEDLEEGESLAYCKKCGTLYTLHHTHQDDKCVECSGKSKTYAYYKNRCQKKIGGLNEPER